MKHSGTIGTTGTGAPIVVWQDVNDLVSNPEVDATTENGYLKFYVNPAKIAQGNAVIAVKNTSGTIMWSWHIWVTPHDMSTVAHTAAGTTYAGLTVNLGWVNLTNVTTYPNRYVRVRVKHTDGISTKRAEFIINQYSKEAAISPNGYNTFFQWGRKDPFIPTTGTSQTMHTAYGTYSTLQVVSGPASIAQTIKAPQNFYTGVNWCSTVNNDLWCVGNNAVYPSSYYSHKTIVKSVYDPCPVGFKVAVANFFNGLTYTSATSYGSYYRCSSSATIYFPWTGYIVYTTGGLDGVNSLHTYNTSTPASNTAGVHLTSKNGISMGASNGKAQGFSVRPMGD